MSHSWKTVCSVHDIKDGMGVCALVGGCQVALFRVNERIFGVSNHDPFSGSNVISRGITGDLQGHIVVASPVYKQHFDLETGICLEDESVCLTSYPVEVVDDCVMVMLPASNIDQVA
ncbi:nitrite reductase [Endozoicomonas montiporae]|uniref:Nitrite reductase n=2 Tax=Endozoicomonas montiporae TaxID=1027273 RepID=A0A081N7E7_9GAMM|nr:nitrite reductase small subunit NirD [Endozoicomonas montiporae]AMO55788.1 nitrite reductase (NADH) large subunit [Endozoicomonas montiporae CL-33]KEQ14370.1 nitrite reductase [Endozoicomonas montiporae]